MDQKRQERFPQIKFRQYQQMELFYPNGQFQRLQKPLRREKALSRCCPTVGTFGGLLRYSGSGSENVNTIGDTLPH